MRFYLHYKYFGFTLLLGIGWWIIDKLKKDDLYKTDHI